MTTTPRSAVSTRLRGLLGLLMATAVVSIAFDFGTLDVRLESWIQNSRILHTGVAMQAWSIAYRFGAWPALAVGIGAAAVALLSLAVARWSRFRRPSIYVLLCLLIGPGLLVNIALKDHWGRPRPRDVVAARSWFHPQFVPGSEGHFTSFTCGHASAGFFLACLYFVHRRRHPRLAISWLLIAFGYGGFIGVSRMAVGAHYPSDVIWSALITCYVAFGLDWLVSPPGAGGRRLPPTEPPPIAAAADRHALPRLPSTVEKCVSPGP